MIYFDLLIRGHWCVDDLYCKAWSLGARSWAEQSLDGGEDHSFTRIQYSLDICPTLMLCLKLCLKLLHNSWVRKLRLAWAQHRFLLVGSGICVAFLPLENKEAGERQLWSGRRIAQGQETQLVGGLLLALKWDVCLNQWYLSHLSLWRSKTHFLIHPGHVGRNPDLLVLGSFPRSPPCCWIISISCGRLCQSYPEPTSLGAVILNQIMGLLACWGGKKIHFW